MDQDYAHMRQYMKFMTDQPVSCRYAMFDRYGGASTGPFTALNSSYSVGDDDSAVTENRRRMKEILGLDFLVSARQVHGDHIYCLKERPAVDHEVDGYDALLTNLPNIGIMIQHADCQAVLLYDPNCQVIGAVHCGWRGSVQDILGKTVKTMTEVYNSRPADILAAISPSLGPCCSEFVNHARELPAAFQSFLVRQNHFDFWRSSRDQLTASGLDASSITISGVCTSCSTDYFSYRRSIRSGGDPTGRNCTVAALGKGK